MPTGAKRQETNEEIRFVNAAKTNNLEILKSIWESAGSDFDVNAKNRQGRTALIESIIHERVDIFNYLIGINDDDNPKLLDLNVCDAGGYSPLALAAYHGKLEFVRQITYFDYVLLDQANKDGKTPMILAASKGHAKVVSYLLNLKDQDGNYRANLDQKDSVGRSALSTAIFNKKFETIKTIVEFKRSNNYSIAADEEEQNYLENLLLIAARAKNKEVAELAVDIKYNEGEYIVDINHVSKEAIVNYYYKDQAQDAANPKNTRAIKKEIKRKEAQQKYQEKTALKIADDNGCPLVVKAILEAKQAREVSLTEDETEEQAIKNSIYTACRNNEPEVLDYLLNLRGAEGEYYLDIQAKNEKNQNGFNIAAEFKSVEAAKLFLQHRLQREEKHIYPEEHTNLKQLFATAVRQNKSEEVKYFLQVKTEENTGVIDITAAINEKGVVDKNANNFILQAVKYNNYEALKVMLEKAREEGYEFDSLNKPNNQGKTPYELAGENEAIKKLFDGYINNHDLAVGDSTSDSHISEEISTEKDTQGVSQSLSADLSSSKDSGAAESGPAWSSQAAENDGVGNSSEFKAQIEVGNTSNTENVPMVDGVDLKTMTGADFLALSNQNAMGRADQSADEVDS